MPGQGGPLWGPWLVAMRDHRLEKPLFLPRKGRGWVAGVLAGFLTSGWKKRSCCPDVSMAQMIVVIWSQSWMTTAQ